MPEPKRPLKVFLCHAHADRDSVRALYNRLIKDGVDAWLDKEKLLAGADWEYEIRKAVRESDVVVVCHSTQFNQKGFRQKEVKIALEEADLLPKGEIFIIPARLEVCDVLDDLKRFHWVDLFETDGYEGLMRALRTRADKIGATLQAKRNFLPKLTPPPPKAGKPETSHSKLEEKTEAVPQPQAGKPKPETAKPLSKFNKQMVIVLISVAVIILVALSSKFWVKPPFVPSATGQATLDSATNQAASTLCSTASGNWDVYVVQSGDTLFSIAVAHDISLEELTAINCMGGNNQIQVGTQLLVPKTDSIALVPTLTATISPLPTEITDAKGVSMVLVPEGEFIFGSDNGTGNEVPARKVNLASFYIDKYEVTNTSYRECVLSRACDAPIETKLGDIEYYGNTKYDLYPVIYVDIERANQYCFWRDGRLPSSFEWEKAARGTDGRIYPWGNEIGSVPKANSLGGNDGYQVTSPVGSFSLGISPYGVFDMSGNVSEFVSDFGQSWDFVDYPMYRGGSWLYRSEDSLTVYYWGLATQWYTSYSDLGFRCARDATNITSGGPLPQAGSLTSSITPTFTATVTTSPEVSVSGFTLISIDKVAYRGGTASAQIQTQPGTKCALGFILPSGILSQAGGLGPRTADENGYCSWTWEIANNVTPGWGSVYIEAGGDSETYPIEIK